MRFLINQEMTLETKGIAYTQRHPEVISRLYI